MNQKKNKNKKKLSLKNINKKNIKIDLFLLINHVK